MIPFTKNDKKLNYGKLKNKGKERKKKNPL